MKVSIPTNQSIYYSHGVAKISHKLGNQQNSCLSLNIAWDYKNWKKKIFSWGEQEGYLKRYTQFQFLSAHLNAITIHSTDEIYIELFQDMAQNLNLDKNSWQGTFFYFIMYVTTLGKYFCSSNSKRDFIFSPPVPVHVRATVLISIIESKCKKE